MPINRAVMNIPMIVAVVILCLLMPLAGLAGGDLPGREVWLPESEVKDRFFSYLIGLVQVDTCGVLDAEDLEGILREFRGETSIPFEIIRDISRDCGDAVGPKEVSIRFNKELQTPVPYSILGYQLT